jgi:hypothetical protein
MKPAIGDVELVDAEPCRFTTDLDTRDLAGKMWRLLKPLIFYSAQYRGYFVVPEGFETNLASIPRLAHPIFPKSGKHNRAAALHDGCYAGVTRTLQGERQHVTKAIADAIFLEAMRADGVAGWRARVMYWAVVIGGDPIDRLLLEARRNQCRRSDPSWTIAREAKERV